MHYSAKTNTEIQKSETIAFYNSTNCGGVDMMNQKCVTYNKIKWIRCWYNSYISYDIEQNVGLTLNDTRLTTITKVYNLRNYY